MAIGDPVCAARHERHHRGPDAARGVFQSGMEAQIDLKPAERARASADRLRRAFPRPVAMPARSPAPPRCVSRASASGSSANAILALAGEAAPRLPGRFPKAALAKGGDHVALIASGMAAHEHLAVLARTDRKARLAILMRRAARHPCCARAVPAKGLGDGFSGHGAPRLRSAAGVCRWRQRPSFRPATIRRARRRSR